MKSVLLTLSVVAIIMSLQTSVQAEPAEDLKAFQDFFRKKFPEIPFDEFSNGLYALPVAKDRREEWEQIMEFPPYEIGLDMGKEFWDENNLASCFKNGGRNIAQHYPYWDERTQMIRTIELDINECLKRKGQSPLEDLKKGTMAQVAAYMKSLSRGQRVKLDISTAGALRAYEEGKQFYWAKRGQLNFSCASCHIDFAGKRLGGNILSPGLGHGVGFPAYRSKWGGIGTLHRWYQICNKQVRAAPFKPQSRQYRHLEFYQTYMQTGLPLTAPSHRP